MIFSQPKREKHQLWSDLVDSETEVELTCEDHVSSTKPSEISDVSAGKRANAKALVQEVPGPSMEGYPEDDGSCPDKSSSWDTSSMSSLGGSDLSSASGIGSNKSWQQRSQSSADTSSGRRCKPCKGRRDHYKKFVNVALAKIAADPHAYDPEEVLESLPAYISEDETLQYKFMRRLAQHTQECLQNEAIAAKLEADAGSSKGSSGSGGSGRESTKDFKLRLQSLSTQNSTIAQI